MALSRSQFFEPGQGKPAPSYLGLDPAAKQFMVNTERGHQTMSAKSTIISQMEQIATEQDKKLAPLTEDLALLESGLDSLSFAILVVRLEGILGVDPFTSSDEVYYPKTLGEFITFYEQALTSEQPSQRAEQA